MDQMPRLVIDPVPAADPAVGRLLAVMQNSPRRTKRVLQGVPQSVLDFQAAGYQNSIGTLLYHIAGVDWAYLDWIIDSSEVPMEAFSTELFDDLFSHEFQTDGGRLTPVVGVELSAHFERLDRMRSVFLERIGALTVEEFRRPRDLVDYPHPRSAEWVLHFLIQHEAEHRGQIIALREMAKESSA